MFRTESTKVCHESILEFYASIRPLCAVLVNLVLHENLYIGYCGILQIQLQGLSLQASYPGGGSHVNTSWVCDCSFSWFLEDIFTVMQG